MPIIKSAKKQVASSARRRVKNLATKKSMREAVKVAVATPSKEALSKVFKAVDKATKRQVIHKNRAARIKSRLSKKLSQTN
jgi:small subunit ribosomal protein S20